MKKPESNAIVNSVEVKVEVGVELGNINKSTETIWLKLDVVYALRTCLPGPEIFENNTT